MKIAFVLDDSLDKPDGVQQYVLALGNWLSSQGHVVHYIVGETHRRDIKRVHSLVKNIRVSFNQNQLSIPLPASKKKIKELLLKEKFDILHVQMPYSPFLAGRVIQANQKSAKIIGTFHILPFSWRERLATKFLGIWLWRNKRQFDEIVSVSEPAARFARRSFGVKSKVLPNVVDLKVFQAGRKLRKFDDGKINIIFLGRLVERKGVQTFLQTLQLLHNSRRLENVRVLICGKGPLEADLKDFVHKNHLSNHIRFEGFIREVDKPDYLASAHIAVFPSLGGESFGIVLIEAMAASAQVVLAGNNPGYVSVMSGHPEQIVQPHDPLSFSKTLHHFIVNSQSRLHAHAWQTKAVKKYDVSYVGLHLLNLYQLAIAKKRR